MTAFCSENIASREAGVAFLVIIAILFIWAHYNYLWFLRRRERRNKLVTICHDEDLEKFFKVDVDQMRKGKESPLLEVHLENQVMKIHCVSPK